MSEDARSAHRRARRQTREARRAEHAGETLAAARTPKQEAEAAWNVLRATLNRLGHADTAVRDQIYQDLAAYLMDQNTNALKITSERKPW